jgi:enoyl-CoA hydratase/carnithine racemase
MAQQQHSSLSQMDKVVIAAVQGIAFGGGASLALSADILILADNARLGFPFVRLGIVPDGGATFLLQSKLRAVMAADLLLTAGEINAEQARSLGLTRRIVGKKRLDDAAQQLATEISHLPIEALAHTKALWVQSWLHGYQSFLSHETSAFALATSSGGHLKALAEAKEKMSVGPSPDSKFRKSTR